MGYLRLFWRVFRFLIIQLPVIAVLAMATVAILESLNLLTADGALLIGFAAVASIVAGTLCLLLMGISRGERTGSWGRLFVDALSNVSAYGTD